MFKLLCIYKNIAGRILFGMARVSLTCKILAVINDFNLMHIEIRYVEEIPGVDELLD